jgi:hypothetical protein
VAKILGDGQRKRTQAFTELVSHFLFSDRFGRPGKGNDKGKVEGLVKFSRANFLTPVPHAPTLDALNTRALALFAPFYTGGGDVSAYDRRVEHLDEMGGSAPGCEHVEERLEHAGFAQAIEPLPYAVPMTKPLRQSAPSHILDREKMQQLQEQSVVLGFASSTRKAGSKHGEHVRPVLFIHPRRHDFRPPNRSEVYESHQIHDGNLESSTAFNSSTRPSQR